VKNKTKIRFDQTLVRTRAPFLWLHRQQPPIAGFAYFFICANTIVAVRISATFLPLETVIMREPVVSDS